MDEKKTSYRKSTEEFKLEALELLKSSGKSAGQIERDLGITPGLVVKWRDRYQVISQGDTQARLEASDFEAAKREIKRLQSRLAEVEEEREILKKNQHFLPEKPMRYKFIREHRQEYSVKRMCQVLGVTRSAYYAWQPEKASPRELENRILVAQIHAEYKMSRKTYGSPRIQAGLHRRGFACGRHRVARLMRRAGIRPQKRHKRYPVTTQRQPGVIPAPNHLNQEFSTTVANKKWVSDFTYIDTAEGWLYLAVVLDLFSRKVVGWAMAAQMDTALVDAALDMALQGRQPQSTLLHHSDQGSQYTSAAYQGSLADANIQVSMSRVGNCYDNAVAESFFGTLKAECATNQFATHTLAKTTIFEYIEVWYNRQRLHSTLGYLSPVEFEQQSGH
ncbi:MAG: IS3 family transposase [Chloroflexota bacterium]